MEFVNNELKRIYQGGKESELLPFLTKMIKKNQVILKLKFDKAISPKFKKDILDLLRDNIYIRQVIFNLDDKEFQDDTEFQKELAHYLERNKIFVQTMAILIKEFSEKLAIRCMVSFLYEIVCILDLY